MVWPYLRGRTEMPAEPVLVPLNCLSCGGTIEVACEVEPGRLGRPCGSSALIARPFANSKRRAAYPRGGPPGWRRTADTH